MRYPALETWENHLGQDGIVHPKGAVRARAGETVLIPGSMGTASYVAEGLGNPEASATCQHGAGRAMSRTAARGRSDRRARLVRRLVAVTTSVGILLGLGASPVAAATPLIGFIVGS